MWIELEWKHHVCKTWKAMEWSTEKDRKAGKENDKHKRGHANSKITVERHSERQAAGNRTEARKRNPIQMGEA